MPGVSRYLLGLRERAVRMVLGSQSDCPDRAAVIKAVAAMLGIASPEWLRVWVKQAEVDAGKHPGTASEESAELKRLRKENAELRRADEILKAASAFFAAELDRPHRL